ncbi:MAG TPA: glycosyltransferase, partial [Gemmatimonadetes bacterium]|nr:glycosyltransferase [Gemmatimonadota bacterium]
MEVHGELRGPSPGQPQVDGKFLEVDGRRFLLKGVAYGTFAPDNQGSQFPSAERIEQDFALMAAAGINTVRTYTPPPPALLDAALRHGLKVMVGLAWPQHIPFLDDRRLTRSIRREAVTDVRRIASHPAALLFALGNEIPAGIVRWHGHGRIARFLSELYEDVKAAAPDSLLTYVNFPPTEHLDLDVFDVFAYNVYLHREPELRGYIARLQHLAGNRPLLLAEAGADSLREGLDGQSRITASHLRTAFAEGAYGAVAYSWTDEWWRGGQSVDDWAFGLVDKARHPKPALAAVKQVFANAPFPSSDRTMWPKVSVVVCAHDAADTIDDCLTSLAGLTYPDMEVIVVNDRDLVVRHAGVFALAEVASRQDLVARIKDKSRAVQRAVLLALARQRANEVQQFLKHEDEQFRYEAARAIYETPIPGAMQSLALFVYDDEPDSERIDWRAIQAARMIGEVEQGEALVHLATKANHSRKIRLEALAVLAEWRTPHGQCRVIGNWRPTKHPDADIVAQNFRGSADELLEDKVTSEATANTIAKLGLREKAPILAALVRNKDMPAKARVAALNALADLKVDELQQALAGIGTTAPVPLRKRAVALLSHTSPEKAVPVLGSLLSNASTGEKQAACEALGNLKHEAATELLRTWLQRLRDGKVAGAVSLDLLEAANKHEALKPLVTAHEQRAKKIGPLGPFAMCLDGGNANAGRKVFHNFEATRCTRCHTLNNNGGNAGPVLNGVGKRLTPEQILASLITPSADIAEGFSTTTVEQTDGMIIAGVITKDQDGEIIIVDINGKESRIPVGKIRSRSANKDSAMPDVAGTL